MSLREIATETLANFNPAEDTVNGMDNIPAGEYDVYIEKAGFMVYDSGYDCIAITAKVLTGDYVDRNELINLNVAPDYKVNQQYPFLLKRNIKSISQLAFAIDLTLTDDDWEDQQTLGDALTAGAIGKQFLLKITESPNKKDPSNPYRNYEFIKYAEEDNLPY